MSDSTHKSTFTQFAKQAQTSLTFAYVLMVGLGMLYYSQKYDDFGINIFQYATILHFLIAPFEDPVIFKLSALAIILFVVSYRVDLYLEKRFPRFYTVLHMGATKASWFKTYRALSWPIALFLMLIIYSHFYAEGAYKRVLESDDITINYDNGESAQGKIIGKTDNVIFLLEKEQVKAIPLESMIKDIVISKIVIPTEVDPGTTTSSDPETTTKKSSH